MPMRRPFSDEVQMPCGECFPGCFPVQVLIGYLTKSAVDSEWLAGSSPQGKSKLRGFAVVDLDFNSENHSSILHGCSCGGSARREWPSRTSPLRFPLQRVCPKSTRERTRALEELRPAQGVCLRSPPCVLRRGTGWFFIISAFLHRGCEGKT